MGVRAKISAKENYQRGAQLSIYLFYVRNGKAIYPQKTEQHTRIHTRRKINTAAQAARKEKHT